MPPVSEEDVYFTAYEYGIKDPKKLRAFMKVVNLYVYATARKIAGTEEPPPVLFPGEHDYLCRGCNQYRPLGEFPAPKQANPSRNVNCTVCQSKRTYKCTGPCRQDRPLADFPERKQQNPHIPGPCSYCEPKMITFRDARKALGMVK